MAAVTVAELLAYCLAKPGAWQDDPFGGDVVAKVGPKVFVFFGDVHTGGSIGVKCGRTRDEADEWIARYPRDAAASAYVGRYGWNSLTVGGAIPDEELFEAVDSSYLDVVARLPKKDRPGA